MNELSLFSGYGGFSLGLRLAGITTRSVAYVEWERYPQEIIKARIKDGYLDDAPIWGDISTFDGREFRGLVDIITGGFPCQPHSVAGKQKGESDARNLWPDTLRIISEVAPRYVLLENVPGILAKGYGGTVIGQLSEAGYDCRWEVISASDVGASHLRKRWWCLGVLADSEGERYRGGSSTERGDGERVVQSEEQGWSEVGSETAGRNRELGDSQYDGRTTLSQLRGDEEAGTEWGTEKQAQTRDSQGTDRPTNATGIRRGKSGSKLADSEGERRQRLQSEGGVSWEPQVPVGNRSRDEGLAYSQNTGLEGVRDCDYTQGRQDSDGSVGLRNGTIPTWPPSPSNASGWERVLRERPDLTPALEKEIESQFRGMDDGRSRRVDELKALGNGIVPAVVTEFLKRGIVAGWLS
jgi:DNA (cytosine-5)-methyltransferase 1